MRKIKLIALDLDGTTLNEKKELTPRTRRALKLAAEKGIQIVVASGRAFSSLPKEVMELPGLTYALTSNGSAVYDPVSQERRFEFLMDSENVLRILELIKEKANQEFEVFYKGDPYDSQRFLEDPVKYGAPERAVEYLQTTRRSVPDLCRFAEEHAGELDAIDLICSDPGERAVWMEQLEQIDGLYRTSSVYYRIELSSSSSGKGAVLKKIARALCISPEEIVAFGNAENDMDMMQFAGLGVAVSNSPEHVRKAADRIAPSNEEDGVAKILEELLGFDV